jgi:hypothetical protein
MLNELTLNEKAFSILSGEHEQYERENGNENENIIGLLKISTALQTDFHFFRRHVSSLWSEGLRMSSDCVSLAKCSTRFTTSASLKRKEKFLLR